MAKFCGNCGSALNEKTIFCGGCGTRVPVAPTAPAAAATFAPVETAYAPLPPSFSPAPSVPAADPGGFTTVPAAFTPVPAASAPPPAAAPVAENFSPVAVTAPPAPPFTPAPSFPAADPGGFTTMPAGFTQVPAASAPPPAAVSVAGDFSPVAVTPPPAAPPFTPAPTLPAADLGGFTAVPAAFTPVPAASAPLPPAAMSVAGNFSPVGVTPPPAAPPYTPAQPTYAPAPAGYTPTPAAYTTGTANPAPGVKKSNTLLKVVVALVLLLFVGGALALAGLWYAAQKIKEKAHEAVVRATGGNSAASGGLGQMLSGIASIKPSDSDDSPGGLKGDPCRFLSKAEVSQAVGVEVIRADAKDGGCSYIAKGDPADMTSKHMASMVGGLTGVDAKTQKTIQKMSGAFFAQQEASDKSLSAEAATGEIPVLGVNFTSGNAEAEMKMNRGAFTHVAGGAGTASSSGTGDLDGIGDDAYVAAGGMLLVRKGNTVIHFMYVSCPCNTDNIKPLAKLAASRL